MKKGRLFIEGFLWAGVYLALVLAPLGIVLLGPPPTQEAPRPFLTEFSVALGFVGLSMMCLQFALTARFERIKAPYGSDIVYAFHRETSVIAALFVLVHPVLLFWTRDDMWQRINPLTAPPPALFGLAAVGCLLIIIVVSIWRRRIRLEYDLWRRAHAWLAVAAVVAGVVHIVLIGHYLDTPAQRGLWIAYVAAFVGLILWVRLLKPLKELREPWIVREVLPERGGATSIILEPQGHPGIRFAPGQFAWITLFHHPLSDREHPFSFSGSAQQAPRLKFTIRDLGDFTKRVQGVTPGTVAYIDGPFGALSADRHPHAKGFVLLAGGVGITPMVSHLETFADRGESRPIVLIYAVKTLAHATLQERIDALAPRLNLKVVHVLSEPPEGWTGERGFITRELLDRHCPPPDAGHEYFICGPDPMMDATERALSARGVAMGDFHSERFNLV